MLLDLRESIRNSKVVKYVLITLICIPFAFFGVNSYLTNTGDNFAARVDGEEISVRDFEVAVNQQRFRLQQMFGGQIPEGFGDEAMLRQQAADSLVTQQVLGNTVRGSGFLVSDQTLANAIQEFPMFQTDGQFDPELYRRELQSRSMNVAVFEASFREDAAEAQFRDGIIETAFELPAEKQRQTSLDQQIRLVDVVSFPLADVKEGVEVADDEITAYFDENADNYKFPERVKIQYLELSRDQLADQIEITDEEAQAFFDENSGRYRVPEERSASHILLEIDGDKEAAIAQANELKQRIEGGEDFATLAKEFSTDVGSAEQGGSLGQFGRGAMVAPFEDAVYALESIGQLSDPVESDFGIHLIKLDGIAEEHGKPFDEVKEEVVREIQLEQADNDYLELSEILSEQVFDFPESLDAAAEETGLTVQASDWLDSETRTSGVLGLPTILQAALSDEVLLDGNNSEIISVGDKHGIALRVLEHEDPRPKTLDDVRDAVIDTIKTDKAGELLDAGVEKVQAFFGETESETPLADLVTEAGGTLTESLEASRTSSDIDRTAVTELFKMPRPTSGDAPVVRTVTASNGDRILMVMRDVMDAPAEGAEAVEGASENAEGTESDAQENEAEETVTVADPGRGNLDFSLLLNSLRDGAEVELNESLITEGTL